MVIEMRSLISRLYLLKIIMTIHEETIAKIQQLPESVVVVEISDYIDCLLIKRNTHKLEL
ncbi:hypothetical protein CFPU101_03320 [Chroococcus sp. FPU101]|nr:hypothetical protein CFPU101_03320 [Chroococcus sp. FPU101]